MIYRLTLDEAGSEHAADYPARVDAEKAFAAAMKWAAVTAARIDRHDYPADLNGYTLLFWERDLSTEN